MTNFSFLKTEFPDIYSDAAEAEKHAIVAPRYCALLCRCVIENAINWLYQNDLSLTTPYDKKLVSLLHEQCFLEILPTGMFQELNLIRLTGNNAAHGKTVTRTESLFCIKNLFRFTSFLSHYYSVSNPDIPPFNAAFIPDGKENDKQVKELQAIASQLAAQQELLHEERQKREEQAQEMELLRLQIEKHQAEVNSRKEERKQQLTVEESAPVLVSEAETRKMYIDILLRDAGWDNLRKGRELEFEVKGMPPVVCPSGTGYADYVLWGDNGLPLAVIEAKRTMADARQGKHQAELYANCIEQAYGQRPVIFYSNGFETWCWDDTFYTERSVAGFFAKDELQLMVDRRRQRTDLRNFKVDTNIAGRPYQLEAVRRVAEALLTERNGALKGKNRKALLVMATGSGKTRVSAAIVDMLIKCNWVKRVLFLADRNALVTQAKNAFKDYLPQLSAIDLTKEKEDIGTRLVFSTYPTIMNKIDDLRSDNGRFYGPGHFDLIIVDEAHRSVYQKYRAIFEYFDALLIGLTATPKTEIDKNTYQLFEIEDNNPTFAYELNKAVQDHFLVPPKALSVPLKFQRQGVKYHELTEDEKREYEEKFGDPTVGEAPDEIESSALNTWLFNTDTVDKVLAFLMDKGIRTHGGDQVGKTIIFAKNHNHALFIEERFNKNYPEYCGKFLRVIDNYEPKAESLLELFCLPHEELEPQVAVSVDMMDTGVDAVRVVNLVFFKQVKSVTKFWQMIGRGTRLCPDLFAPGEDKTHFVIFDFCENFEFFEVHPEGINSPVPTPISQQLFELKLDIALRIRAQTNSSDEDIKLASAYLDELHQLIATLDHNRFMVRKELRLVKEYEHRSRWENLSPMDRAEIGGHLSCLPAISPHDDETAKRFDLIVLNLQLAILSGSSTRLNLVKKIVSLARLLEKKQNIPIVQQHIQTIKNIQSEQFWKNISLSQLEQVRSELRDLIKFIDTEQKKNVYTHFEDDLDIPGVEDKNLINTYTNLQSYRERVETFIRNNKDFLVINKIQNNKPITREELELLEKMLFEGNLGSKEEYRKEYGDMPLGRFIRSILGLDKKAANQLFSDFIQSGNLTADQITFINNIIDHLTVNGIIEKTMLFEPPFTNLHDQGITGIFDEAQVVNIIRIIDMVNDNAVRVG